MTEQQAIVYKQDLEKVQEELTKVKKLYLTLKKRVQTKQEESCVNDPEENPCENPCNMMKFAGGGFKLSGSSLK